MSPLDPFSRNTTVKFIDGTAVAIRTVISSRVFVDLFLMKQPDAANKISINVVLQFKCDHAQRLIT